MSDRPLNVDELLAEARAGLHRLTPAEARQAALDGALLVDIRPWHQRAAHGDVPDALPIDRTVLEWRLDPASAHRVPAASYDRPVVVICQQGYSSSLAAATLCRLGVQATDLAGGVDAWIAEGMPTVPAGQPVVQPDSRGES